MSNYNIMYDFFFCEYILHKTEKIHDNYQLQLSLVDLLNDLKMIFSMIIFDGRTHFPCHTIMPKIDDIGKFIYFKFNYQ